MVITNDLDLNVGQISLTFRNGKLNLRFESIVTASSATAALIFLEILFIQYFTIFSCKQYDVITDLIA